MQIAAANKAAVGKKPRPHQRWPKNFSIAASVYLEASGKLAKPLADSASKVLSVSHARDRANTGSVSLGTTISLYEHRPRHRRIKRKWKNVAAGRGIDRRRPLGAPSITPELRPREINRRIRRELDESTPMKNSRGPQGNRAEGSFRLRSPIGTID